MILIKSTREIALMREAGRVVAQGHQLVREVLRSGMTTQELDRILAEFIRDKGGIPSFLGYMGYPANVCISINEELIHGIPGPRVIKEGDTVSVDIGVYLNGYHGDSGWTYAVGEVSPTARRLMEVTEKALYAGIEAARVGNRLSSIGSQIQRIVQGAGYHVPKDYVGHGVGQDMHEDPDVLNYWEWGVPRGPRLRAGTTLAIEPMVVSGTDETYIADDQWTIISADHSLTCHFEHTIAVTAAGPQILTAL